MPDNRVNVQFVGEDAGLKEAFTQVNGYLHSLGQSARQTALELANATQNFSKPKQTLLDLATQAAATGTNLTEAGKRMREAGDSANEMAETTKSATGSTNVMRSSVGNFTRDAVGWTLSFLGLASAFQAVKHAIVSGAEVQTAQTRLNAIIGSADQGQKVFGQLNTVAQESVTNVTKVTDAAIKLYGAGASLAELPEKTGNLAKIADISGEPLEEIVNIIDRIHLRAGVTWRDLIRLGGALGDQTRNLAVQYRNIEPTLRSITAGVKAAQEVSSVWHTQLMQNRSAIAEIQDKLGLTSAIFKQWQNDNMLNIQHTVVEGFAGRAVRGLSRDTTERFREGIKEIAYETHLSENAIARFVREGKIEFADLIAWSDKYQERLHTEDQRKLEATRTNAEIDARRQELAILEQVEKALNNVTAINRNYATWQRTAAGEFQKTAYEVEKKFQEAGTEINKHLDGVKDAVIGLTLTFGVLEGIKFAGLLGRIGGITAAWQAVTGAAEAAGTAMASAEAGELALMATRAGILGAITLSLQTDTDYKNPERKKQLQEEFKKEAEDPWLKQWREEQAQYFQNNPVGANAESYGASMAAQKVEPKQEAADVAAILAAKPAKELSDKLSANTSEVQKNTEAMRQQTQGPVEPFPGQTAAASPSPLDFTSGSPTGILPTALHGSGITPTPAWLRMPTGFFRGFSAMPTPHGGVGGGPYRTPTDLSQTGGGGSVIGIGASLEAEPDVARYDDAHDPYHIGPRMPDAPRRPVDPMEVELIRQGNMSGLTAFQQSHHLTQLPFQKEGDQQTEWLSKIHGEVQGQRQLLGKVLSASQ